MKVRSLITRSIYFIFSTGILFVLYLLLLGNGPVEDLFSPNRETSENGASELLNSDLFLQTAQFSDEEVSDSIELYETGLSGISARFGANVRVQGAMESTDSEELSTQHSLIPAISPVMLSPQTGKNVESSELLLPPQNPNPFEADIWRIETSWASHTHPSCDQMRKLIFYHKNGDRWEKTDVETFLKFQGNTQPVIFYVHGNRTEVNTALVQGMQVLRNFPTAIPARLVIWNWDSERVSPRPHIEYSTKANYADFQGFYLANLLNRMNETAPVLLVGHSFGTRVILSSLHLLGKGSVGNQTLETAFPVEFQEISLDLKKKAEKTKTEEKLKKLPKLNVLLVAAAISRNVLVPGSMYDCALNVASEVHITRNGLDPALRFYPLMYGHRARLPEALGYAGPILTNVGKENEEKVHVIRLEYQTHQFLEYISMRCVKNALVFE